ncbi:MAG: DUF4230 domain-containing protein [Verrucomicrobiota bacterium]
MTRSRVILMLLFLVLVLFLGTGLGLVVSRILHPGSSARVYNTAAILRQVQTLSQLVTVKYVIEKVVIFEDAKWYGENRVLMVAHGVVKAGIDLSQLQAGDLSFDGNKITIHMPEPAITDVYLEEKKTQVIERTTGLLRQFDKDLEQNARIQAVDDIRRAARYGGIIDDARQRGRQQLVQLFQQLGFEKVEFVDTTE